MAKKTKSKTTVEKFLENPRQKKIFEEEHKDFLLSELVLALMAEDHVSVRKLAKAAGVSPTVIQALRSGKKENLTLSTVASIAQALGYSAFLTLKKKGEKQKVLPLRSVAHKQNAVNY
ncbi:helix-turn-helix domain-containing protein [Chlamydiota bacterium]